MTNADKLLTESGLEQCKPLNRIPWWYLLSGDNDGSNIRICIYDEACAIDITRTNEECGTFITISRQQLEAILEKVKEIDESRKKTCVECAHYIKIHRPLETGSERYTPFCKWNANAVKEESNACWDFKEPN